MKKVAFLGASLTGQYIHHLDKKPTGYFFFLQKYLHDEGFSVKRFTYPGSRFEFGAWMNLSSILEYRPDCIFLELCVEDYSQKIKFGERSRDYYYFFRHILESGIAIGLLMIDLDKGSFNTLNAIQKIAEKLKLPYSIASKSQIKEMHGEFRGVHTTTLSAALLAAEWKSFIFQTIEQAPVTLSRCLEHCNHFQLSPPTFSHFHSINLGCSEKADIKKVDLLIDSISLAEKDADYAIALQSIIGPHSSSIKVIASCQQNSRLFHDSISEIRDKYCHYEREAIKYIDNVKIRYQENVDTILIKLVPLGREYTEKSCLIFNQSSRILIRSTNPVKSIISSLTYA